MKCCLIIFSFLLGTVSLFYVFEIRKLEMIVFNLYVSGFQEYMYMDKDFMVNYDKEKLKKFFEKEGYCFQYEEGLLSFTVSFKRVFFYEKDYRFYLERNYEVE